MDEGTSVATPAMLATRFKKTERITALVIVAVAFALTVTALTAAPLFAEPIGARLLLFPIGLGLIVGNVVLAIRIITDDLPWDRGSRPVPVKPLRRAALKGDVSGLDRDQLAAASDWAAVTALNLRATAVGSVLFVAGFTCVLVAPQLIEAETSVFLWLLIGLLVLNLAVCVPIVIRYRRLSRFAEVTGAWERIPAAPRG